MPKRSPRDLVRPKSKSSRLLTNQKACCRADDQHPRHGVFQRESLAGWRGGSQGPRDRQVLVLIRMSLQEGGSLLVFSISSILMAKPPPLPEAAPGPPPVPEVIARIRLPAGSSPAGSAGAKLDFDPSARGLRCPYCGFTEVIPDADETKRQHQSGNTTSTHSWMARNPQAMRQSRGIPARFSARAVVRSYPGGTGLRPRSALLRDPSRNKPEEVKDLILPESVLPLQSRIGRAGQSSTSGFRGSGCADGN